VDGEAQARQLTLHASRHLPADGAVEAEARKYVIGGKVGKGTESADSEPA